MSKKQQSPVSQTNVWDFLSKVTIHLIDVVVDKGRLGSLLILIGWGWVVYHIFNPMVSADRKDMIIGIVEKLQSIPWMLAIIELLLIILGYHLWKKQKKNMMSHIEELARYKHFFFHMKITLYQAFKEGKIKSEDDLYSLDLDHLNELRTNPDTKLEIKAFRDIEHTSSGYQHPHTGE